jgi:hypothetical protein
MGTPETYDSALISVSPFGLYSAAIQLNTIATDIANQLNTIYTAISDLQFSWTGGSASEAQDFSNRLNAATDSLFGTKKNPDQGAFNRLAAGLMGASQNYNAAEEWVISTFNALTAAFDGQTQPTAPQTTPPPAPPGDPPAGPSVELLPSPPGT